MYNSINQALVNITKIPRGKDISTRIQYSCNAPSRILLVDTSGTCHVCACEAWLPVMTGNILDYDKLSDVWESRIAKEVQQDIADKKYTFCAVKHCGVIHRDIVHQAYQIHINVDESCQLACPSCRKRQIYHQSGEIFDKTQEYFRHIFKLLEDFEHPIEITMSGNGDVLSSQVFRPILLNWVPRETQLIKLFTNGLLMKTVLPNTNILPHIQSYSISIDAGSKEVYEKVRRPGKFANLLENLDWLASNRQEHNKICLNFCLQASNAHDMINFVNLAAFYGFNGLISNIENWGTFDNFEENNVIINKSHPLHNDVITQLQWIKDNETHIVIHTYLQTFLR